MVQNRSLVQRALFLAYLSWAVTEFFLTDTLRLIRARRYREGQL